MKVASNKISDIKFFIRTYLQDLYPVKEIDSLFYILMETYCGMDRNQVHAESRVTINESELLLVYDAIKELKTGKPVQYIIGHSNFYNLEIKVNKDVLIPRPETEELVDIIIKQNIGKTGLRILDIGTGSGCIAIALKKNLPKAEVFALDISEGALQIARQNAITHQTEITFIQMDVLDQEKWPTLPDFDIIVSNPPYVMESEKELMHKNVLEFEPNAALFVPEENPLLFYKSIIQFAKSRKNKNSIYFEINENKANNLIFLCNENEISDICIVKDFHGKERILIVNN